MPARDRDRFVREVVANMADRQRWWQRVEELLSVAAAVPGLAVILRWRGGGAAAAGLTGGSRSCSGPLPSR